jgi:hypothetical protein
MLDTGFTPEAVTASGGWKFYIRLIAERYPMTGTNQEVDIVNVNSKLTLVASQSQTVF